MNETNKEIKPIKIVHAQTIMLQSDLDKLKAKSKQESTKDALSMAVQYYIEE